MSLISVRRLSRSFGEIEAVQEVGFEVEAGEIFGFLGPNGAGKTTTIKRWCSSCVRTDKLASLSSALAGRVKVFFPRPVSVEPPSR